MLAEIGPSTVKKSFQMKDRGPNVHWLTVYMITEEKCSVRFQIFFHSTLSVLYGKAAYTLHNIL